MSNNQPKPTASGVQSRIPPAKRTSGIQNLRLAPKSSGHGPSPSGAPPVNAPTENKSGTSLVQNPSTVLKPKQKPVQPGARLGELAVTGLNLVPCRHCGRKFASDRLPTHEKVCTAAKGNLKKRKPYDSAKHRLSGTDAESLLLAPKKKGNAKEKEITVAKPDWRQRHKELQEAAKAARAYSAHIAAGGKAADLPPPPPSENRDYIGCPYCGRRFNQSAAERHIPVCQKMAQNKPKMIVTSSGSKSVAANGPTRLSKPQVGISKTKSKW